VFGKLEKKRNKRKKKKKNTYLEANGPTASTAAAVSASQPSSDDRPSC
jgi:hypothetical protein